MFEIKRSFRITSYLRGNPRDSDDKTVTLHLGWNDHCAEGQPFNVPLLIRPDNGCWSNVPLGENLFRRDVLCHIRPMDEESTQHCDTTNLCWIAALEKTNFLPTYDLTATFRERRQTYGAAFAYAKPLSNETICIREFQEEFLLALLPEELAFIEAPENINRLYHVTFTLKN